VLLGQQYVPPRRRSTEIKLDPSFGQNHPLHILIAEDNFTNQQVVLRFLSRLGYRADVAANGLEVLMALRRQPYDIILLDVQMPEMDGFEAARRIRQDWPEGERPRLVAMTANAMQGDRERCLEAGMNDYISKPIRVSELVRVLNETPALNLISDGSALQALDEENSPSLEVEPVLPVSLPAAIDKDVLRRLSEDVGVSEVPELVQLFLKESSRQMEELRTAVNNKDVDQTMRKAHTLKSSSAMLGALTMSGLCLKMEMLGRDGNLNGADELLVELEENYAAVREGLWAEVSKQ
jgi:CheY-like chemotaxis protein